MRDLASAYSEVRRQLETWAGYEGWSRLLREHPGIGAYVAGGVVRNCFVEGASPTHDFDFFLSGPSVRRALEDLRQWGQIRETPYGAPRWYPHGEPARYADLIPVEEFQPGLWRCEDILDVLNQFDFTANAVAFDLRGGQAFDPQNGVRDALLRRMRMVRFDFPEGPFVPGAPLSRKAVLWFRILHYSAKLRFSIEPLTLAWLRLHAQYREQAGTFEREFFVLNARAFDPL